MAQDRRSVIPNGFYKDGGGKGQFAAVNAAQSDSVFWNNQDSVQHWPVPGCSNLNVEPGKSTPGFTPFPAPPILGKATTFVCAVHPAETGTLTIWPDFLTAGATLSGTVNTNVALTKGGMLPVSITSAVVAPSTMAVSVVNGAVVANASVAGTYTVNLVAVDGLGVQVSQISTIKIT